MKEFVFLASFFALALFGYYLMARLDAFLRR